ncbi:abortive infection family protein [Acinetobacter johnsonii]|uniref:abortive infection family protein n=1 Tax=Acinetobacter johnsonii TaxID=40214 RepID=UPI0032B5E43A
MVGKALNLSPSQHTEQTFKQILGGCSSIVEGLGALRNKVGDAHGQGKVNFRPAPRHAELAVNLAGTMSVFLFSTWDIRAESEKLSNSHKE